MNRKVSLKEIVGTKIVYAVFLVFYFWMWVRTDWKEWYPMLQSVLFFLICTFFLFQAFRISKYKKEGIDEMAEQNLKRCDSLCLKLFIVVMIAVAWGCAIFNHAESADMGLVGWIIVLSILVLSVVRTIMFAIMDSRVV